MPRHQARIGRYRPFVCAAASLPALRPKTAPDIGLLTARVIVVVKAADDLAGGVEAGIGRPEVSSTSASFVSSRPPGEKVILLMTPSAS